MKAKFEQILEQDASKNERLREIQKIRKDELEPKYLLEMRKFKGKRDEVSNKCKWNYEAEEYK